MPELEAALVELGRSLDYPPAPELSARVRERAAAGRPRRFHLPERRALVVVLAVLAVAVGAVLAVPQTRAAILELLRLRGVTIERVEELPPATVRTSLDLGEEVTLAEAERRTPWDLVRPEELGEPDSVHYRLYPPGGMVSFVYGDPEEPRALVTQFQASVEDVVLKKVASDTRVEPVTIDGAPGYWLAGEPHFFAYVDREGMFSSEDVRLAGNVLLWERGDVTMRLEADVTKQEALEIARSAE